MIEAAQAEQNPAYRPAYFFPVVASKAKQSQQIIRLPRRSSSQ